MTSPGSITSKGFTIVPPVREDQPNTIQWKEGDTVRTVTYFAKSSMGFLQRMRGLDPKLWKKIGEGDTTVYVQISDWNRLSKDEQHKLDTFFKTSFREALSLAKKVHVEVPELGPEVAESEAKRVKSLVRKRIAEMVAAAKSSPKHTSKMELSSNVGIIRCETTATGGVKLSVAKGAGKGSFKTVRKMIDFGSVEKIIEGNKTYAYLKLHGLKRMTAAEAEARIAGLREEVDILQALEASGVRNIVKLYRVKTERRQIEGKEVEVPVGIMMEWCNMGDAEWMTNLQPTQGSPEYNAALGVAFDAAVGMHSIHATNRVHGDLKSANLFLKLANSRLNALWGDLGGCVPAGELLKTFSLAFLAPEQIFGRGKGKATKEGEVWSFGILLLQMFHGKESNAFAKVFPADVFERSRSKEEIDDLKRNLRWALAEVKKNLQPGTPIDDVILRCLSPKPEERPSAEEIMTTLRELLPKPSAPPKRQSAKERSQREAAAEQQIVAMRLRATKPQPPDVTIVEVGP